MKVIVSKDKLRVDNVNRIIGQSKSLLKAIEVYQSDVFETWVQLHASTLFNRPPGTDTCGDIDISVDEYTDMTTITSALYSGIDNKANLYSDYTEFDWSIYLSGGSMLPIEPTPHHFSKHGIVDLVCNSIEAVRIDDDKKNTIYADLKDISEELSYSDHKTLRELGGVVRQGLSNFDAYHELAHLVFAAKAIVSFRQISKQNIKSATKALQKFVKRNGVKLKIDLRKKFRSIIKFLFKNMKDLSGADNVLFSLFESKQLLSDSIFHFDGFKRNCKTIRAN